MSDAMMNMWISFVAIFLMFISAGIAVLSREKLKGWIRNVALTFSFVCLCVAGIIVFLIVIGGPTATLD